MHSYQAPPAAGSSTSSGIKADSASPSRCARLPWCLPALAALGLAALVEVAQGWTNSHLFGHGSLLGPLVLSGLSLTAARTLYGFSRHLVRPQHRLAFGLAHLLPALYACIQFLLMGCEGCAASG